ncbi:MAG: C10 family peptidase [Bacteroidales bacterium]|nr:C10 family peptidase [Bacteroidales bacterium]
MKSCFILKIGFCLAIAILFMRSGRAETVSLTMAKTVAENTLLRYDNQGRFEIDGSKSIEGSDSQTLFFLFHLSPAGYIVVSGNTDLPPVIAYSFSSSFYGEDSPANLLEEILISDLKQRLTHLQALPEHIIKQRHAGWNHLLSPGPENGISRDFHQWPSPGTTTTGGWIETLWSQGNPYNTSCPLDPVTWNRSLAGCPAVAMAMVLNYHQKTNDTHFSDQDDYYHSYAGRQYWIDNDYSYVEFPSFPELNTLLDTLSSHYKKQAIITSQDKAALIFACGVAAHQVYTSSISGTFGIQYAHQAYQKFQFNEAILLWPSDTGFFNKLIANMKEGLPAHLSVNNEAGNSGHNVVVDGYNTDNYFHVNFGWGGSYNGWYLLPEEFPYGMTVLKGVIVDIGAYQGITLDIKLFLEGPYNGSEMNTFLNGFLPLNQPFNIQPWNYPGSESVSAIPSPDIVDWILVDLRETNGGPQNATPDTKIALQAGFLLKNGHIVGTDGLSPMQFPLSITQELYCAVWHRNHVGILSAFEPSGANGFYSYDFSTSHTQIYGGTMGCTQLTGGLWGMAGGDGNADGQVNNNDKNDIWAPQAGSNGYQQGDFNLDIQVNNTDKNGLWKPNTGLGCQVP